MEWENGLNALTVCCSSHSATQVDGLTPVQEAAVAVFSFAEHWTLWLLQCSLAALLSGATWCVWVCVSNCEWIVRKHLWEWQLAPPPLMSAEWTNPHTTHSAWQQAAVMVPFSSLPSFFFLFLPPYRPLSLSLPFKALFKIFHLCTLYFSFFCIIFLVLAKPTEELAITTVVGNLLPAFQYTHRHTFAHSSTYTIAQSLPLFVSQCKQTKNNYTAQRPSFSSTSRQRGL